VFGETDGEVVGSVVVGDTDVTVTADVSGVKGG